MWDLDADLVCLSIIFSWNAPIAREIAIRMKDRAEIWCGGPGMFTPTLERWWRKETGLEVVKGLDQRFDKQRGIYDMTFASRGCPIGCSFCIVHQLEGLQFSYDPDFIPAPKLCDNNLSALPADYQDDADYQDHIIERYRVFRQLLVDACSGFEPHSFTVETYQRWKPLLDETYANWRFALAHVMRNEIQASEMFSDKAHHSFLSEIRYSVPDHSRSLWSICRTEIPSSHPVSGRSGFPMR